MNPARISLSCLAVVMILVTVAVWRWPEKADESTAAAPERTTLTSAMEERPAPKAIGAPGAVSPPANASVTQTAAPSLPRDSAAIHRQKMNLLVNRRYGPFFQRLEQRGTSAAQWHDLLLEEQLLFTAESPPPSVDVVRERWRQIAATVGTDAFREFLAYDLTRPERNVAADLAASLQSSSHALSEEQQEEFILALAALRTTTPGRSGTTLLRKTDPLEEFPERERVIPATAFEVLRTVLSAAQLEKLAEKFQEQQQRIRNGEQPRVFSTRSSQ